jgi:hypothetical protein
LHVLASMCFPNQHSCSLSLPHCRTVASCGGMFKLLEPQPLPAACSALIAIPSWGLAIQAQLPKHSCYLKAMLPPCIVSMTTLTCIQGIFLSPW